MNPESDRTGSQCRICGWQIVAGVTGRGFCRCHTIYLAARFGRIEEMRAIAGGLEAIGWRVTSRWIRGGHDDHEGLTPALAAREDVEDITAARVLAAFTEGPGAGSSGRARGGRHWEAGYAFALKKRIIVVGPRENVFYNLPGHEQVDNPARLVSLLRVLEVAP